MTTITVFSVTYAYRVRIDWAPGQQTFIGDYPTRRIAQAAAERFVADNAPRHS